MASLKLTHEYERYYGTAFMELFEEATSSVRIEARNSERTSFLINGKLGLYLKHSSARSNTWNFGFRENDYLAIKELKSVSKEIAFACICGFHGVCIISSKDFEKCAGYPTDFVSRITVRTKVRGSWTVTGSAGELSNTRSKTKPWLPFKEYL